MSHEESRVSRCFSEFRAALIARDGERAADLVSRSDHDYFDHVCHAARHASRARLAREQPISQMLVILARARLTPEELGSLSGREFIVAAYDRGWIDGAEIESARIDDVRVYGAVAYATYTSADSEEEPFRFCLEDGQWRVDLSLPIDQANATFASHVDDEGLVDLGLIVETGMLHVDSTILEPPFGKEVEE